MKIATTIKEVREAVAAWKKDGLTVGLVPTMGALHEGHASLVDAAKDRCDRVVASIRLSLRQEKIWTRTRGISSGTVRCWRLTAAIWSSILKLKRCIRKGLPHSWSFDRI